MIPLRDRLDGKDCFSTERASQSRRRRMASLMLRFTPQGEGQYLHFRVTPQLDLFFYSNTEL